MSNTIQEKSATGSQNETIFNEINGVFDQNSQNLDKTSENQAENCKNSLFFDNDFSKKHESSSTTSDPVSNIDSHSTSENIDNFSMFLTEEEDNKLFSSLFPGVNRENAENDPIFKLFARDKAKNKPFTSLYSDFRALVAQISDEIKIKGAYTRNNIASSPGSLSTNDSYDDGFFTKEQVLKMSREQIAKNYDKIRKSQQKW